MSNYRSRRPHGDEYVAILEQTLLEQGYHHSVQCCEGCEKPVLVKVTRKPAHWESDVTIITFNYYCPRCDVEWQEHDSD